MSEWINVNEKIPEEGDRVIYYSEGVGVHCGKYAGGNQFRGPSGWIIDDVTHWMPMPAPPKPKFDDQDIASYAAESFQEKATKG